MRYSKGSHAARRSSSDTTGRLVAELGELKAASEPDREELRRLRRENHALKAELARRGDSENALDPAADGRSAGDGSEDA